MDNIDEEVCSICYDSLENNIVEIECGHTYHTNCIVKWFRTGNKNCPLCNDTTIDTTNISYLTKIETIKEIKKLGRKKSCPENIKKILIKIKNIKDKQKEKKKQLTEFKKQYKEEFKIIDKLRNDNWKYSRELRLLDYKLLAQITINPIYIK